MLTEVPKTSSIFLLLVAGHNFHVLVHSNLASQVSFRIGRLRKVSLESQVVA